MIGTPVGQLLVESTGKIFVHNLHIANRFWPRFVGLQFRKELPPGTGLLLFPATSIHMFFMRFPIDLLFLDSEGVIVEAHRNVLPWTVVICKEKTAVAALELPVYSNLAQIGEKLTLANQPNMLKQILN